MKEKPRADRVPVRVIVSDRVPAARRADCAARNPKVRFEVLYVR
ncbi:hypothetical protein T261_7840 [Streptomyces lydicus]|nr:hypothetical protein T261_7840 [Streptomyces lydicus]